MENIHTIIQSLKRPAPAIAPLAPVLAPGQKRMHPEPTSGSESESERDSSEPGYSRKRRHLAHAVKVRRGPRRFYFQRSDNLSQKESPD